MAETLQDLYGKLERANVKLPDYSTFEKKYSVEGGADVLYGKLSSANVKLPDVNTFKSKYFSSTPIQKDVLVPAGRDENGYPLVTIKSAEKPVVAPVENQTPTNQIMKASLINSGVYDSSNYDEYTGIVAEQEARNRLKLFQEGSQQTRNQIANESKKTLTNYYEAKVKKETPQQSPYTSSIGTPISSPTIETKLEKEYQNELVNSVLDIDRETYRLNIADNVPEFKPDFNYVQTPEEIEKDAIKIYSIQESPTHQNIQDKQILRAELRTNPDAFLKVQEEGLNPQDLVMDDYEYSKAIYKGTDLKISVVKEQQKYLQEEIDKVNVRKAEVQAKINSSESKEESDFYANQLKEINDFSSTLSTRKKQMLDHEVVLERIKQEKGKQYSDYLKLSNERDLKFNLTEVGVLNDKFDPSLATSYRFLNQLYDWSTKLVTSGANVISDTLEGTKDEELDYLNDKSREILRKNVLGISEEGYASKAELLSNAPKFDKKGKYTGTEFQFNWYNLPFQTAKVSAESGILGIGGAVATSAFEGVKALQFLKYSQNLLGRGTYGLLKGTAQFSGMLPATYILFSQDMFENEMQKTGDPIFSKKVALARVAIETASELLNPLEINQFTSPSKLLTELSTEQAEKLSVKMFGSSKWAKAMQYMYFPKEFGKTWLEQGGKEYLEEFVSNVGNWAVDKSIKNGIIADENPDYKQENEISIENEVVTAINTIASMGLMAGTETVRSHKNAMNSAQFMVGANPELFKTRQQELLTKGKINAETFEKRTKEIDKISNIYNFSKGDIIEIDTEFALAKEAISDLKPGQKTAIDSEISTYADNMKFTLFLNNKKIQENSEKIPDLIKKITLLGNKATNEEKQLDALREEMLTLTLQNQDIKNTTKEYINFFAEKYGSKIREANVVQETEPNPSVEEPTIESVVEEENTPVVEETQPEQEEVVVSPIEQVKQNIQIYSKEELEKYNPFRDKTLSPQEKKEANELKIQKLQEIADKEATTETTTTTEDGEVVTQGDALFSQMGVKPVEVVEETPTTEIEAKKADIENKIKQINTRIENYTPSVDKTLYPEEYQETKDRYAKTYSNELKKLNEELAVLKTPKAGSVGIVDKKADIQKRIIITGTDGGFKNIDESNKDNANSGTFADVRRRYSDERYTIEYGEGNNAKTLFGDLSYGSKKDSFHFYITDKQRNKKYYVVGIGNRVAGNDADRNGSLFASIEDTGDITEFERTVMELALIDAFEKQVKKRPNIFAPLPQEFIDKINAKYDEELKALEKPTEAEESVQQTEVVTPQEVSGVKPQTVEKAEKEQEKEVVEKFTEPANPFKNGKVKTSNWNAVLSKITDLALPNYRVRVVNTNSLTLEQLPFQTKKYFEDQARIQKTTVEDVMSKDKGKMLVLTDKEGNYILESGLPVITNFPDGLLAEYKAQYERQGLSEEQYNDKINQIKQARKNNSTLLIERISNFPVEITQDSNELSVAVGTNDFSIAKGSKGFPVAMLGSQEVNLISRKLNATEIDSILYILFKRWATSGSMSDKKSDKYQKAQYVQRLILTGTGVGKINFKGDPKLRTWEITLKQPDNSWKTATEQEVRDFLKNQYINVDINLSKENTPFTTYKIEDGKTVVDKTYPTYKDFLKDTIKTKGVSATKLQDNFYIEVGDTDGTLSAKLEEAKNEPAVAPVVEVVKPTPNTEIVEESQAVEEVKSLLDKKKKKSLDAPTDKDNFAGLLRSKKLSQEVIAEQNKKAKEWFDKSPLAEYISLNQLQNIVNSDAYASWNWGAITLFKGSQYTDLYHEAWHEFSQLYLTKKQKEALYGEIKKLPQYKDFTNEQIEEVIAEDFRNYAKSDGKLILNNRFKRNSTFRRMWNFLKELFTKTTDLQTVYERLYTGNISKYKRNTNNAFWGNLNLGIQLKDNKQLSDTDTKNLYRAIDSLIGTIFQQNGKPVTMMFADNKVLATVYGAIYKRLATEYNDLYDSIEERTTKNLSQGEAEQLKADAQLLDNLDIVIENWNEIVKTHRQYSAFFNISKDKIAFDEEGNITSVDDLFTEETDEGNSRNSELIKNENVSSKEMASNETIFTIATLRRYNSDGTVATNPFLPFVADIVDFNNTWDKLTTSVNNTLNYDQLIDKITKLGEKDKSFKDLQDRLPDPNKTLSDDEQRMKGAFMNDISKPLVNVYELVMKPLNGKMLYSYNTAASSDVDKVKKQWNDNFESGSPFIKQHPDDSLYTDIAEIKATYSARGTKPAFYYNKADYNKADKTQMFENRIDFLSNMGIKFTEDLLSDIDFKDFIIQDFVKTDYVRNSPAFAMYDLITNAKGDISSLTQLYDKQIAKPSTNAFKYYAPTIEALANYEVLGSNSLFAQSVKNAANNSVWQIRQWNYITKIFNALNDVQKYPTYQDLIKEDWLKQFDFEANPYVKGIYLNTLFDLNPESATYGQRRVIKKGKQTIYPTISLHDYNGMRLNASESKANEGKQTTGLTAFEKIVQNINSLLLFNTQENLRYGDKSSSYSTMISHYLTANGKLEDAKDRKSIISFSKFTNGGIAELLPTEAYKILVSNLKQEVIPMIRFKNDNVGVNLRHYNKNIKDFGTFNNILTEDTKDKIQKQIIDANVQDEKEISKILLSLPLREEFETYIATKSEQLSELLDTDGLLNDLDLFDPKLVQTTVKEDGKNVPVDLPKQSIYYAYIVNSLLYNMEHTKLISFDPRFYKTANDVIKRLSAWSATGNMFIVDAQTNEFIRSKGNAIKDAIAKKLKTKISDVAPDGSIRSVIFTDNKYSANKLLESYKEKFLATGKYTAEQLNTILKAYTKIEEGDGQGYVTLDLLRQSKLRAGSSHWTKEHEAAYQKEAKFINGESTEGMSLEEMTLFTVQKWQYAGIGLENGIPYPTFYKFSVVPLIPSAIEKTNFKAIHENLIKQNVGLGLFESGSKASSNQEVELNPDGSIKLDKNGNPITKSNPFYSDYAKRKPFEGEYTINNIFFQYLKEQVNIEPKLKGETMFSTQMRKLLHLNLYNNGVPNDVKLSVKEWNKLSKTQKIAQSDVYKQEQKFGEVIEKLVEIERNSLLKKMGATQQPDGNYKIDAEKLSEFFREEFIKRDLPNEVVNYLQAENGEFKFPIDAFKQRATIERIASSIANKKLVQQKMTGEALIQVASTGFELTDKFSEVREDNDLPFYTEPGKAQKVKIAFTERWKPLLNLEYKGAKVETLDRLNEAIKDEEWLEKNRKVITIVGVRIPVQGLNSQEYMEVFHFLPESMGGVIIVSPALVAKSGGDFDVDKLTTFFPNIFENKYTGEVKLYNSKDIKFTDLELTKQLKEIKKPSQEKLSQFSKIRKELKTELDNYKKQKESIKLTKAEARTFLRKLDVEIALLKQNLQILEEVEFAVMQESLENQISEIIADVLEENIVLEATQSAIEQTKIKIKERINDANIQQKFILKSINESLESLKEDIEYTRLNIQTIDKSINPIKEYLSNIQELIYQSSPKKAYENELIDLIRETLSRAENFQQLVRPNDTDLLNNTEYGSEKLKNLFPKPYQDNTFTSVVDFASILEKFKSNLVGKSNLGIAAVNNVFFALAQRAGLRHGKNFTYIDSNNKFRTKPVEYYLPHNTIEEDGEQFVSLSGLNSKNSENYISDIISQYINGFVDVANDDWIFFINAVKEFAPTMLYTAMAGTNAKTTIAFFNQPIMRDYIKKIDKYKNIFTKFKDPQSFQLGNWKALEEAAMDLVWSDETLSEIVEQAIASTRPDRTPQPFLAIRKHILETVKPTFLTEKRLSEALYEDKPLSAEEQIFAILHFWELRRQSGIVTNLQRSLNSDTKKVGTGYSSKERQLLFEDVEKSGLFNTDAMYRMRNESTVRAFTNDKTGFDTFSQQLFTDVFEVTNHPTFSEIIRELIKNDTQLKFEFKFSELEKLVNTIKNDFITYLYQNQVLDGNDNLFKKMQPLFNPKSSMALELKNLKEKYPNLENQFPILGQLIPDNYKIGNKILKTNLKLKKALADKDELNNATRQMRELIQFSSNSYTPEQQIEIQQFTDRLIKFIIVQSGLNPSVYNLLDIVPNEHYTQNIKHIIKDVQKALDKDVNKGFSLKKEKKSGSQKNLEIFYNRFKIERPTFFNFTEDEEGQLPNVNRINQRGVNYYLPKTDITGAKAQEAEDKLLAYIPTLPYKSIVTNKTNAQTIRKNPKSLAVVYDNLQESNTEALKLGKVVNFATMTAKNKETIDSQIDTIIAKSMGYETISFDTTKGYFQDIKESNPELFNYGSQRLKDTFGITNLNFEEIKETPIVDTPIEEAIEQPIQNKEGIKTLQDVENKAIAVIKSTKGDDKYIFLNSQKGLFGDDLVSDDKQGQRLKGKNYKGIDIVSDYFTSKTIKDKSGNDTVDILFVDSKEDAQKQFDNYIKGGAKQFSNIKFVKQPINKEIKFNELQKQNLFTVKPIQAADKKAVVKASLANKYIGFGEGIANSSTELYRQQVNEEYNKAVKEANARPSTTNIPQNLQSGVEQYGTLQYANKEAQNLLGKNVTSIELIENGFRTRTTRTDSELLKYNIKVGSYIKMFGKDQFGNTKNVIVKITKITKGYNDATWYKEGWTEEGLEKLKKHTNSANAVEFEVVKPIANVGNYNSNDVVFVSISGKRGDSTVRKEQQDKTIKEALKAIEAGATLITDNKAYVESSDYNEGEKRLAKNLEAKGYNYSEQTIDGQVLGIWNKNQPTEIKPKIDSSKKIDIDKIANTYNDIPRSKNEVSDREVFDDFLRPILEQYNSGSKITPDDFPPDGQHTFEEFVNIINLPIDTKFTTNGKPTLLYHGSSAAFSIFDEKFLGTNTQSPSAKQAFFAAKDKSTAITYGEVDKDAANQLGVLEGDNPEPDWEAEEERSMWRGMMSLDEDNPIRIKWEQDEKAKKDVIEEAKNRYFEIEYTDRQRDERVTFYNRTNIYPLFFISKNPKIIDVQGNRKNIQSFNEQLIKAKQEGYDAVLFKNVKDSIGGRAGETDVYTVFSSSQIINVFDAINKKELTQEQPIVEEIKPKYIFEKEQEAALGVEDKNIPTGTIIQINEEGYNGLFRVVNPENDSIEFIPIQKTEETKEDIINKLGSDPLTNCE